MELTKLTRRTGSGLRRSENPTAKNQRQIRRQYPEGSGTWELHHGAKGEGTRKEARRLRGRKARHRLSLRD